MRVWLLSAVVAAAVMMDSSRPGFTQIPPSPEDLKNYRGLFTAAVEGNPARIDALISRGADVNARDSLDRTPLQVAVYLKRQEAVRVLAKRGSDINAFDNQRYDAVTIASVADDPAMLDVVLSLGGDAKAITSPYNGTALIAAAHLGHDEVVRKLIAAGAPLDHVNNLGWTALIEAIVLGKGGPRHTACVKALLDAGANANLADRNEHTPLALAKERGYAEMITLIESAGGK
jgi:ankyrin repeat protein